MVYIETVIESDKEERDSEWVQWANTKADRHDSTITYNDELPGTRQNGKSNEEKEKELKDMASKTRGSYR